MLAQETTPTPVTVTDSQGIEHTYTPRPPKPVYNIAIPEDVLIRHFTCEVMTDRGEWFTTRVSAAVRTDGKTLSAGFSFCSKNDNYVRTNGLERALNRLETEPMTLGLHTEPTRQQALDTAAVLITFGVVSNLDIPGMPRTWSQIRFHR